MEDISLHSQAVKVSVVLNSKDDWRLWYEAIQTSAILAGIWEYINPDIVPKPEVPQQPAIPEAPASNESTQRYNHRAMIFNAENSRYILFQKGRAVVHNQITSSISRLLKDSHSLYSSIDLYDLLKKLKDDFAPSLEEQKISASIQYNAAKDSKVDARPIDNWITEFEAAAGLMMKLRGDHWDIWQAEKDFLDGIKHQFPGFADRHLEDIMNMGHRADLFKLTTGFQRYLTTQNTPEAHNTVYGTFKGQSNGRQPSGGQPNGQNSRQKPPKCVCGRNHFYKDCWHVNKDAKGRPTDYQPDPEVLDRAIKEIKANSFKGRILKRYLGNSQSSNNSASVNHDKVTFSVLTNAVMSTSAADIRKEDSWIVDTGGQISVCNNLEWFDSYRPHEEYVKSGNTGADVQGIGIVTIRPNQKGKEMSINNVRYIPGFHTNIVSAGAMRKAGVFPDLEHDVVRRRGGEIFCNLQYIDHLWYIETNRPRDLAVFPVQSSSKLVVLKGDMKRWHDRYGHISFEALEKLPAAVQGIKMTDISTRESFREASCHTCRTAKADRQISQRDARRATEPFRRVHFDLITINPGLNGHRYVTHLYKEVTGMHFAYTHYQKNECVAKIKDFVQLVERQWERKVKTIFSNNEVSLGRDFKTFIAGKGIIHQTSVPGTPEQNGFAERSGGVIIARTRRIRIAAQLPHELWPWLVKAAVYQLNRTPTKRLG
jgi:transposase InsO family protein